MKTILLPIESRPIESRPGDSTPEAGALIDSALATAALLARAFGGYVEGFALAPDLPMIVSAEAFGGAMVAADPGLTLSEQDTAACRKQFEDAMTARGLHRHGGDGDGPSFGWHEDGSVNSRVFVASYGRVFDLCVLCRPVSGSDAARMALLETALFDSGRPALIAPPAAPAALGDNIVIAWNGTPEAARSVAFARPLLERAGKVTVVTVTGSLNEGPDGDALARNLRRNGIACEAQEVAETEARGAAFLEAATRLGADLLVKGAYTQSRLRQMIFGGATRHIVTEATLPVFMAH
jgi:nucleotide-binding universal stress UspA family protein